MLMNRDYLDILRRLRTIDMTAHARKQAQQEARRAVLIVEVLARAMDNHDWGGGRLVLRVTARLRGFSRALRRRAGSVRAHRGCDAARLSTHAGCYQRRPTSRVSALASHSAPAALTCSTPPHTRALRAAFHDASRGFRSPVAQSPFRFFFAASVLVDSTLATLDARDIRLRTMKARATALLVAVVAVYVVSVSLRARYPWLAYVAAAAEAGIIGALADWFAVVALFQHPFNIRAIPHTNIIARNKDRLARQIGEFIQYEFLSPEVVTAKVRDFNPARRLAQWLTKPANAETIAGYAKRLIAYSLVALDDERVRHFLYDAVGKNIREIDVARLAALVLELLTHEKRHHVLFDAALAAADGILAREDTRRFIADELARQFWLLKISQRMGWKLSDATAAKLVDTCTTLLKEVRNDPQHDLRRRFDTAMATFVSRLKNDASMRARVEELKCELLDSVAVRRYVEALWTELRAWVQSDVEKADSTIHAQAVALVRFLGQKLDDDREVQAFINEQILEEAPPFVRRYRESIGHFIEDQIHSWTTEKLVDRVRARDRAGPPVHPYQRNRRRRHRGARDSFIDGACSGLRGRRLP